MPSFLNLLNPCEAQYASSSWWIGLKSEGGRAGGERESEKKQRSINLLMIAT